MKTLMQIAKEYKLPPTTLRSALLDGRLNGQKMGRDWLIIQDDKLAKFLQEYKPKSEKK